jgi:hypothetical protein
VGWRSWNLSLIEGFELRVIWWACDICDRAGKLKVDSTNAADRHLKSEHSLQEHDDDELDQTSTPYRPSNATKSSPDHQGQG